MKDNMTEGLRKALEQLKFFKKLIAKSSTYGTPRRYVSEIKEEYWIGGCYDFPNININMINQLVNMGWAVWEDDKKEVVHFVDKEAKEAITNMYREISQSLNTAFKDGAFILVRGRAINSVEDLIRHYGRQQND